MENKQQGVLIVKGKTVIKSGLTLLFGTMVLAGCQQKQTATDKNLADKQVLNWNETSELATLDPSKASDSLSFDMIGNSQEGLYRLDKKSQPKPALADTMKSENHGQKYVVTLRKNVKWSNGKPVTAKDFVYSWRRTVAPKTGAQYAYLFDGIHNANEIIAGKKEQKTLGIKATGKHQLTITLDKKIPYFKLLLSFPIFFPQNQQTVEKYGDKYGTASKYMVYSGPFKVQKWSGSNLSWNLKKNTNYWDKSAVKLAQINFKVNKSNTTAYNLYQTKKLDMLTLDSEQAKNLKNNNGYQVISGSSTRYLEFNQNKKVFKNLKIRQAISMGIDRQKLVKSVIADGSVVSNSIVPKDLASYKEHDFTKDVNSNDVNKFNQAQAQKLLKQGLSEVGEKKLSLSLLTDDTDQAKKNAEFIQSQLEDNLGITVKIDGVPFKTRLARSASGDFDLAIGTWGADFTDPISMLDTFVSSSPYNFGKWKNQEYDDLIARAKNQDSNDPAQRWQDLVQAADTMNKDVGLAILYQPNQAALIRSNVKNVVVHSAGQQFDWKETYIGK